MRLVRTLAVIALAIVLSALAACADIPATLSAAESWRDEAAQAHAHAAEQLQALEQARAEMPPQAPDTPVIDASIAVAQTRLAALDAALRHADLVLAEMRDPADPLTLAVQALSPILPPQAQGPAVLGAALLATIVRARRVRKGADSIAASIQAALKDPEFQSHFQKHAATIRSIQTPTARRIVDEATRPGFMIRTPF